MSGQTSIDERIKFLTNAFSQDGFEVDPVHGVFIFQDRIGITGIHCTASIGSTGNHKKAYYVEGSSYEMGFLLGMMSEPEISSMCTRFSENIVFDFIRGESKLLEKIKVEKIPEFIKEFLQKLIHHLIENKDQDIPAAYHDEIKGILEGCRERNQATKVAERGLWTLNIGIDALLAYIYTGLHPMLDTLGLELISPHHLRVPIMCNGFAAFGEAVADRGHFMGRDFMFPTADVFQDTACILIQNPTDGIPFASVTAPGMMGAITGLNRNGVAVGVDMVPAANCNPARPGFNSLLLARYAIQHGASCDEAVKVIEEAPRGVSWLYLLADGTNDKACIVEAGRSDQALDFLSYPINHLKEKNLLPDEQFLEQHQTTAVQNGMMVRWNDFIYPEAYLKFNQNLITEYHKTLRLEFLEADYSYAYAAADFGVDGYLNHTHTDRNCPMGFYFAPQREQRTDVLVVTNHYLIPEMRLCSMSRWSTIVSGAHNFNDIQWRYDELHHQIFTALERGPLTYDSAKEAIDFLSPKRKFPEYYNMKGAPLNQVQIPGCVSLFDLKKKTVESHFGYYSDEWIKISLMNYLE